MKKASLVSTLGTCNVRGIQVTPGMALHKDRAVELEKIVQSGAMVHIRVRPEVAKGQAPRYLKPQFDARVFTADDGERMIRVTTDRTPPGRLYGETSVGHDVFPVDTAFMAPGAIAIRMLSLDPYRCIFEEVTPDMRVRKPPSYVKAPVDAPQAAPKQVFVDTIDTHAPEEAAAEPVQPQAAPTPDNAPPAPKNKKKKK